MIATIVKHQWFSGSPLPLNEWFGRNHWYQWFFNGFWSINHWPRCFFSLATIGLDGFAMVFGLATIGLDGFSMVANHWSNDGMVTIHRSGLPHTLCIRFPRILALHCYRCYNRNEIHTHCKMHHCLALFASTPCASLLLVHPCYNFYISKCTVSCVPNMEFHWKLLKKFRIMIVYYK